ncbi:hypothetical protein PR003_g20553 [Phytophthora rubi]|uniref:Uncharacterized protein n=1 Tax=Phytophthora rubi TaxID=129364 RepID=A0A6A4DL48_9STRA|nr:hypothetical protein PR003_g20553 [Phytophthora rubi]
MNRLLKLPSPASTPAARQRVLWCSDSVTRGGKTSIGILLAWLAAPGNYARPVRAYVQLADIVTQSDVVLECDSSTSKASEQTSQPSSVTTAL